MQLLKIDAIPKATHEALVELSTLPWLNDDRWYLAGGTALALMCGHRISYDLDFFTQDKEFDTTFLINKLGGISWQTDYTRENTLYGNIQNTKVSFIAYPFFTPAETKHLFGSIGILDSKDVAVMKIIAISQRGRKRDFVDLYWYIVHREPLVDIVKRVKAQYPETNHNYHHILKSLAYFGDADTDPDPILLFEATWEHMKKHIIEQTGIAAKELLLHEL